jgi:hypothetical protein
MKFRETKFCEIIHFVVPEIFIVISQNVRNFMKFREIFATKFRFLLDDAKKSRQKKNNVAEPDQKRATSFSSPFST